MQPELLDGEKIFVIHELLSAGEARELIERSEQIGYEVFTIDGEVYPDLRNNARAMLDDEELADWFWSRIADLIPARDGSDATGLSPRFRFYRYRGTEKFAPHFDGSVRKGDQESQLTFMVYLNDVEQGGETRFLESGGKIRLSVKPQVGMALLFEHQLLHEAVPVEAGEKYVIRTDVLYPREP